MMTMFVVVLINYHSLVEFDSGAQSSNLYHYGLLF